MSIEQVEIQVIAAVVALACALPGVFLILRKMAMMSDAISHSMLFGIILAFFVVKDITSPFLIIAAALTGVLTVSMVEVVNRTKMVKEDTAIGLIFPFLFSIAVILIARYAGSVHLDTDSVLLGELAFAPFNRMEVAGWDIGPKSLYVMGGILLLNVSFIIIFYKELKISTFDSSLAFTFGFAPAVIHYALMGLISVTAVGAFDSVGAILVVALMVVPPLTAYMLTDRLSLMLIISGAVAVIDAVSGYWLANITDASIAGSMAVMAGVAFAMTFLLAPEKGMIALMRQRMERKLVFARTMLLVHLYQHEGRPEAQRENRARHLTEHLNWDADFARSVVRSCREQKCLEEKEGILLMTENGRTAARNAIEYDKFLTGGENENQ